MKKAFQNPRLYLLGSLITAVPTTVLQVLAYLKAYQAPSSNYFASDSLLPKASVAFALLGCALAIVGFFLQRKTDERSDALPHSYAPLASALGFLGGAGILLLSDSSNLVSVTAVCLILAAAYQILLTFRVFQESAITAMIGFSTVVGCILTVGYYYFDSSLEMNAPVKIHVMMGLLLAMLCYTAELRFLLGIGKPKIFKLLSCATVCVGALTAIPLPVAFLAGCFDRASAIKSTSLMAATLQYPAYLAGAVILLGITVTAAWRMLSVGLSKENDSAIPAESAEATTPTERTEEDA